MERQSGWLSGSDHEDPIHSEEGLELLAEQHEAHAPAARVDVQEELKSVVIAEEADDDKTPLRGPVRYELASSPELEVSSAGEGSEVESPPVFEHRSVRPLPAYDHRNDPTVVLPRRPPNRAFGVVSQLAPQQFYVVVAAIIITGCAAAFIVGAAVTPLFQSSFKPEAQPAAPVVAPTPSVPVPSAESIDTPVSLTDLPVADE